MGKVRAEIASRRSAIRYHIAIRTRSRAGARSRCRTCAGESLIDSAKATIDIGQPLIGLDELLQAVDLHQLIDVLVRIGIGGRVLVLQLGHQQLQEIVRRDGGAGAGRIGRRGGSRR